MHCKNYSHFFSKKFQHICVSLDVNFNESLTNDVVSFEQLGPDNNLCCASLWFIESTDYESELCSNCTDGHTDQSTNFPKPSIRLTCLDSMYKDARNTGKIPAYRNMHQLTTKNNL